MSARVCQFRPRAIEPIRVDERSMPPGTSIVGLTMVSFGIWCLGAALVWKGASMFWRAL